MNKGLVIGGLAVVLGGGYYAGIAMTAKQVDEQFARYVSAMQESYAGVAEVSAQTQSGTFDAQSTLSMKFLDLPEEVLEWAGSDTLVFDISYKHGFLKSDSVVTLADSQLKEQLAEYQANPSKPLLQLNATYSYDIASSGVTVDGVMEMDGFTFDQDGDKVDVGAGSGSFSAGKDTLVADYKMAPSKVLIDSVTIDIGEIGLVEEVKALGGDILTAKMSESAKGAFTVADILVKGPGADVQIQEVLIDVEQAMQGERMELSVGYGAQKVKFVQGGRDFQFDQPKLALTFDLDSSAVISFVEQVQALQAQGSPVSDPEDIFPLLDPITQGGINVDIDTLEVSSAGEQLKGNAALKIAPFSMQDAQSNPAALRDNLDMESSLKIAKGFLAQLPNYNPQQAQFAVSMGFLKEEDDSYSFSATLKNGEMKVNGNPMPLF
ncbi:MAG: DUF945 family protein [Pseudomonadales bacterium]